MSYRLSQIAKFGETKKYDEMKMTKDKFHPELKSIPFAVKMYTNLLRRKSGLSFLNSVFKLTDGKITKGLVNEKLSIPSRNNGPNIRLRVYRPENNSDKLPVMLYLHGGGYAIGNPEQSADILKSFISRRPCVIVAPGYRKSQTDPYPAAFHDCYDTLLWIKDHADTLHVDINNLIIAGHSAGGGLTAAVTLKARDTTDVSIAFQMPIYPMIDDRHKNESSQFESPIWGKSSNRIGWDLYLKGLHDQSKSIPSYAAPARNKNYARFPPTFTFVGGIDPFRDETIEYVESLKQANIPVKFKLFEGCYHAFEFVTPKTQIAKDAMRFMYESYDEFYDTYIK